LHHKPRKFGKDTSLWTLDLAAEVSFEEGLTEECITGETVRATLARMGVRWERAKRWIESPEARGKEALLLIWDNASWHKSHEVRGWIAAHNREVKDRGCGIRIVASLLLTKSPWLNAIEPQWIHGKRKVVEPE